MKNMEKIIVMVAIVLPLLGVQNSYGQKSTTNSIDEAAKQILELRERVKKLEARKEKAKLPNSDKVEIEGVLDSVRSTLDLMSASLPKDGKIQDTFKSIVTQRGKLNQLNTRLLAVEKSKTKPIVIVAAAA